MAQTAYNHFHAGFCASLVGTLDVFPYSGIHGTGSWGEWGFSADIVWRKRGSQPPLVIVVSKQKTISPFESKLVLT